MTARSRLLFMAKPQPAVLSSMVHAVNACRLDTPPGTALFAPENWHQTLSSRYANEPDVREGLRRAGALISATAVTMVLSHLGSQGEQAGSIHWALRVRGEPQGFRDLQLAIQSALRAEGLADDRGHSPHVTISYWAPAPLRTRTITPITWIIDEVQLVEGGGQPYCYQTIDRWPLAPPVNRQLSLF